MTNPTTDPSQLLASLRAHTAGAVQAQGDAETLRGTGLAQQLLDSLPVGVRKHWNDMVQAALQAAEVQRDPMAALQALLATQNGAVATSSLLGMGNGTLEKSSDSTSNTAPTITPAQQELLDAFKGTPEQIIRIWADWCRRSGKLDGDQAKGFPLAIEEMLDGTLRIDPLGRPNAEAELKKKNSEISRLENELEAAKNEAKQLEVDLNKEKAKTSAPAAVSDELLTAVNLCIHKVAGGLGFEVPASVRPDDELLVLGYLKNQFQTDFDVRLKEWQDAFEKGGEAKKQVAADKRAAKRAYDALGNLTYDRKGIYGLQPVGDALRQIDPALHTS